MKQRIGYLVKWYQGKEDLICNKCMMAENTRGYVEIRTEHVIATYDDILPNGFICYLCKEKVDPEQTIKKRFLRAIKSLSK